MEIEPETREAALKAVFVDDADKVITELTKIENTIKGTMFAWKDQRWAEEKLKLLHNCATVVDDADNLIVSLKKQFKKPIK